MTEMKQQTLDALQAAWKAIRLLETVSADKRESEEARRALFCVDKAFAELERGK